MSDHGLFNDMTPQQAVMRFWLNWFQNEARVELGETLEQAHDRLAGAMSAFMDEEESGFAAQQLEVVVSNNQGPCAGILRSAFRRACSRSDGQFGDRLLRAQLLFIPIVVRTGFGDSVPQEIDASTVAALCSNFHEHLNNEGRSIDAVVPVTAVFTVAEMDHFRPVAFYGLLKYAFKLAGIGVDSNGSGLAPLFRSLELNNGVSSLRNALPPFMIWQERHDGPDPAAFREFPIDAIAPMGGMGGVRDVVNKAERTVTGRYLTVIWIADKPPNSGSSQNLPGFLSDGAWLEHIGDLLTRSMMPTIDRFAGLMPQPALQSSASTPVSLTVLGASDPVTASNKLHQELSCLHLISAARSRISMLEAQNHWKDGPSQASVVYDPQRETMMLVLDGDFQHPSIAFAAPNSVWVYPLMARIAKQLEEAGCDQVSTRVLDHSIQSGMDIQSYGKVH